MPDTPPRMLHDQEIVGLLGQLLATKELEVTCRRDELRVREQHLRLFSRYRPSLDEHVVEFRPEDRLPVPEGVLRKDRDRRGESVAVAKGEQVERIDRRVVDGGV